jgi:hypothetical protein
VPLLKGFFLGANAFNHASYEANTLSRIAGTPATTIDVGAQHRFTISRQSTLLRFQINNLTDKLVYAVQSKNS